MNSRLMLNLIRQWLFTAAGKVALVDCGSRLFDILLLLLLLLRTFVERKIRIKYIKCAKSAVKQNTEMSSSGLENVQRDVRCLS